MPTRYQEDLQLAALAKEVLAVYDGPWLKPAKEFVWRIIFTNATLGHEEIAGKCTLVQGPVRFLWRTDFIIQIHKQYFDAATDLDKVRILVHEFGHIGKNDETEEPALQRHNGDFCEIAEHDKRSYGIAESIVADLKGLKDFTRQVEVVQVHA